jgi:hypothetical protein
MTVSPGCSASLPKKAIHCPSGDHLGLEKDRSPSLDAVPEAASLNHACE